MPNRSRIPYLFAGTLGLLAVLLLWSRAGRHAPAEPRPHAAAPRREAPAVPTAATHAPRATPPLETPATEAQGAFVVRVVAEGRPLAGAQVRAFLRGPDDGTGRTPWRRAAEGTTAEDGTLRLPAAPGLYLLSARAEGHAPARREVPRPAGESETAVELALVPGVTLRGRTVEEGRGEPVPLAEVRLSPYTGPAEPSAQPSEVAEEEVTVASDAEGRFGFSGLAPGRYQLTAEAPGHSRRTLRMVSVPREGELVVGLWAAGVLEGFVVDARGQPAAGAEVVALGGPEPLRTTTGEGGGFSLEAPGGTYALSARKGEALGRLQGVLLVTPGDTLRGLTVRLGPAGGLAGTVTASNGKPVKGAHLVASPAGAEGLAGEATTGEDGHYTLDLAAGEYDVMALAPGYTPAVGQRLTVRPGARTPWDVKLEGTAAVEGVVTDEAGRPQVGVTVSAKRLRGTSGPSAFTRTDTRGAYRLEDLEVGTLLIQARRDTSALWQGHSVDVTEGATKTVDFILTETGRVEGVVRQTSGEPVKEPALVRMQARQGQGGEVSAWASVETDAAGRFQVEVPVGAYQASAVMPGSGYLYYREDDTAVTVEAGTTTTVDLALMEDRGVHGVVREPSGAPSPRATVSATQGGDFPMTVNVETDEDGRFGLPPRGAQASPLELAANNAGRTGEAHAVREDGSEVVIQLRPSAVLRGRVVARNGAPPADGFTVKVLQADGAVPPWSVRSGGAERTFPGDTFVLYDAPAQALKLEVRTADGRSGEAAVTLAPGQEAEVEVALTGSAASISGRAVWSTTGAPADGVAVFLDRQVTAGSDTHTGPDGRFRLENVRPGPHTVRLLAPDGRPESRTVKVADSEAVELGDVKVAARRTTPGTVGAGFSEERGRVSVAWVSPEGPAAKAGVHVGDALLAVDGVVVRSRVEAESRTRGTPGTPVRLNVRRDTGEEHQVQLTRAD